MEERSKKETERMPPMKADEDTQTTDLNKVLDSLNTE